MSIKTCCITGCTNEVRCRGWCGKHYARYLRHGDPAKVLRDWSGHSEASRTSYAIVHQRVKRLRGSAST